MNSAGQEVVISISVVIPAFNRAATIGEALSSVRAQRRQPLETIVVDDASTDDTAEVAAREGARVITLPANKGAAAARNEGMRAAVGDAIAWLDSDDYWEPSHLAVVAGLLDEYPEAAAASAAVRMVGSRSETWNGRIPEGPPSMVLREAFRDWLAPIISTVIRRDALMAVGGFDESERYSEDFDLWLRLARRYRFVATREITAYWRWHSAQLSADSERQLCALYKFRIRTIEEVAREGDLSLVDDLSAILRSRWADDVQAAWDKGQPWLLRQLVEMAPRIPDLPATERLRWELRSRIPGSARPLVRSVLRIARSAARRS